ncbi:hypothetical protein [Paraburkholderia strydomiana]|uniref:hypothetical protein n=1 Tax=Paraburkholderia strydomiana TaxID=1245417 RepID=UPI0038BA3D60
MTDANIRYGASNTARLVGTGNQTMDSENEEFQATRSAIKACERRMTLRLYAVGVVIVVAVALLRHFWT